MTLYTGLKALLKTHWTARVRTQADRWISVRFYDDGPGMLKEFLTAVAGPGRWGPPVRDGGACYPDELYSIDFDYDAAGSIDRLQDWAYSVESLEAAPDVACFFYTVYFPASDLPLVRQRLRAYNRHHR